MLANALFVIAVIGLAATTMLSAGMAMTRASVHRIAQRYLVTGYQQAAMLARTTLAGDIAGGRIDPRSPTQLPAIAPLAPQCATASVPCAMYVAATIALDGSAGRLGAVNLESNGSVNEGRLWALVTVNVTAADGTMLATRAQTLTLRTFATPPYVTVAGARDASFDGIAQASNLGDDGGIEATGATACSALPAPDETVVRVQYRNAQTGACVDGSRWRNATPAPYATSAAVNWSP
ncbi:MAG TPA: hypothetical protein VIG51_13490 [Candidatus Baltobacteraceae bacterium]|jgi:hypothetical protein